MVERGCHPPCHLHNERPPDVRRSRTDLRARVNGDLQLEFADVALTSYAGLELFGRYLRATALRLAHSSMPTTRIPGDRRLGAPLHLAQNDVVTYRHAEGAAQSVPRPPAEGVADHVGHDTPHSSRFYGNRQGPA